MTDDLVKRLRGRSHQYVNNEDNFDKRAADRIEQLEKGFVDILSQQPLDLVVAMIAKSCLAGAIDQNGKYCFVGNLKIVDGKPSMGKTDD